MGRFIIDNDDFGIDSSDSHVQLKSTGSGIYELRIDIQGDKAQHRRLSESESSPWHWAMYPPNFYVRGFRIALKDINDIEIRFTVNDFIKYNIALYMMAHNNVEDVALKIQDARILQISGVVDLMGRQADFRIDWIRPTQTKKN